MWSHNHPVARLFETALGLALDPDWFCSRETSTAHQHAPTDGEKLFFDVDIFKQGKSSVVDLCSCSLPLSLCFTAFFSVCSSLFLLLFLSHVFILHWTRLNDGAFEILQNTFTIRIEKEKGISNSTSLFKLFRSQSYLCMTHKNSDFVQAKGILDPLLKPLWLCTHMRQGGEGRGKGEERYSTKAQLQT